MWGKVKVRASLTAALMVVIGCHHDKHKILFTPKEEAVLPPNEDRYNNPPTAEYQKRTKRKEDPTLLNKGGKMGGMGGPGPINPGGF